MSSLSLQLCLLGIIFSGQGVKLWACKQPKLSQWCLVIVAVLFVFSGFQQSFFCKSFIPSDIIDRCQTDIPVCICILVRVFRFPNLQHGWSYWYPQLPLHIFYFCFWIYFLSVVCIPKGNNLVHGDIKL